MIKIFQVTLFLYFLTNSLFSSDLREFEVGADVSSLKTRGYTEIKCLNSELLLNAWSDYKKCNKNKNNLYYVSFEYDDKFAFNENFEGTQVAGHPVIINIGIEKTGILEEINVITDDKAPFYFRKQAHLFWMRVYSKYGSSGWKCENYDQENNHLIINRKYVNKSCFKISHNKKIFYHTQLYFINNKEKDSLVSKTTMKISLIDSKG